MFDSSNNLLETLFCYKASLIVMIAHKEGVIAFIGKGQRTAEEVAKEKRWLVPQTQLILNVLVNLGFLSQEKDRYFCNDTSKKFLLPGTASYLGDLIELESALYRQVMNEDSILKGLRGGAAKFPDECNRSYMNAMEHGVNYASVYMVRISRRYSPNAKILDLGGGPGQVAVTFCRLNEKTHATVFDLPHMRQYAEERIRSNGYQNRIQTLSGDCLQDSWGNGYDTIVISNLLHFFGRDDIVRILKHSYEALLPNGIVLVHDFFTAPQGMDNLTASLSTIDWLVMGTPFDYSIRSFSDIVEAETDFSIMESRKLAAAPTSLIVLQKQAKG